MGEITREHEKILRTGGMCTSSLHHQGSQAVGGIAMIEEALMTGITLITGRKGNPKDLGEINMTTADEEMTQGEMSAHPGDTTLGIENPLQQDKMLRRKKKASAYLTISKHLVIGLY